MISKDIIKKIIEFGTYAPSGDNSQPWRFEVLNENQINIYNLPEADNPLLNVGQRGSFIAHGALIENILIASSQLGYKCDLEIFPEGTGEFIAKIILTEGEKKNESFFPFIKERLSNRKPYKKESLTLSEKEILTNVGKTLFDCRINLIDDKNSMRTIAEAMSVTEKVALETPELHKLFFDSIIWDEKKNEIGKKGLYIKTLEIPPPIKIIFKIIKNWSIMKFFNKIGFSKLASKGNENLYFSASAHGAIIVDNKDKNFILAGRALQNVWLNATGLGLSMQLVTGLPFLNQKIESLESHPLSEENSSLIKDAYKKISLLFGLKEGEIVAVLFRIGKSDLPSARSKRMEPEIIFKQ